MQTRTIVDDELDLQPVALTAREATVYRERAEERLNRQLPVSSYERGLYIVEGLTPPAE